MGFCVPAAGIRPWVRGICMSVVPAAGGIRVHAHSVGTQVIVQLLVNIQLDYPSSRIRGLEAKYQGKPKSGTHNRETRGLAS